MANDAYQVFVALDGTALEGGKIFIGEANDDPELNPVNLYWDAAKTTPAAQPLRTSGGVIVRDGTPADVFSDVAAYSIRVRDRADRLVWYKSTTGGLLADRMTFPIPSGPPGAGSTVPGPASNTYSTRADLAASSATNLSAILTQQLRSGVFRFAPGNQSTLVAADPVQGAVIPAASNPTGEAGAWVRTDPYVTAEMFGTAGDGVTDDRLAIQTAINVAALLGIRRIRFLAPSYVIRHTVRSGADVIHDNYTGHGLVIPPTAQITLESACGRTDFLYKSPAGNSLQTDWQMHFGKVWRGAGIFIRGPQADPGRRNRPTLTLDGIHLQGGTLYTGNGTFPANTTTGDGWDLTHKCIWAENDYYVGDITLYDSGLHGFRGEVLYQGGTHNGGLIARNIEITESNANAFNPNTAEFYDVDGAFVSNVYQGFEGWGGYRGRIVNATFENVHNGASRFSGGTINLGTGAFFYSPARPDMNRLPVLELDVTFRNSGNVWLGSFLTGRVTLIDTPAYIAPLEAGDFTTATKLRLDVWADRQSFDALTIYGTSPVPHSDISLEIHTHQTDFARQNGFAVQSPVFGNGALGSGIEIVGGSGPIASWPRPAGNGFTGTQPRYRDNHWTLVSGNESAAHQVSVSGPTAITPKSSNVYLSSTIGGQVLIGFVDPGANGFQEGTEVTIYCDTTSGASFVFRDTNQFTRVHAYQRVISGGRISFKLNGGVWKETYYEQFGGGGAIPAPTGGTTVDAECRASVNALRAVLATFGITA